MRTILHHIVATCVYLQSYSQTVKCYCLSDEQYISTLSLPNIKYSRTSLSWTWLSQTPCYLKLKLFSLEYTCQSFTISYLELPLSWTFFISLEGSRYQDSAVHVSQAYYHVLIFPGNWFTSSICVQGETHIQTSLHVQSDTQKDDTVYCWPCIQGTKD